MIVTVQWIRENYERLNNELFGGQLPTNIDFLTSNRKSPWGFASYRYNRSTGKLTPTSIVISNYYDSEEWVKLNILIHEMIHIEDYAEHPEHFMYYSYRTGRYELNKQYDAHGETFFLPEARRMKQYGYDIEKYVSEEEEGASRLSDRVVNIQKKKLDAGIIFYLIRYNEPVQARNGQYYNYGYCKVTSNNEGSYINRFFKEYNRNKLVGVGKYISHSQAAVDMNTSRGGAWYLTNDIESIVRKFDLKYVERICGYDSAIRLDKPEDEEEPQKQMGSTTNQLEIPFGSDKISLFRMPLKGGGVLELKNVSKEEIAQAIKDKFPNFSEEVVKKLVDNANFYPNKEKEMKESKMINIVDEAITKVMGYNMDNDPMVHCQDVGDEEIVSII